MAGNRVLPCVVILAGEHTTVSTEKMQVSFVVKVCPESGELNLLLATHKIYVQSQSLLLR